MPPPLQDAVPAGVKSLLDAGRERLAQEREAIARQRADEAAKALARDLPAAKAMRALVVQSLCPSECREYVEPAEDVTVRRHRPSLASNAGRRYARVLVKVPGLAPIGVMCEEDDIGSMRFQPAGDVPVHVGQPQWKGTDRGVEFEFVKCPKVSDFGRAMALAEESMAAAKAMFERQKDVPF